MVKRLALVLTCSWLCLAQGSRLSFGGSIAGAVTDEGGSAIVGGHVAVYRLPPYPKARLQQSRWNALSDAGGFFRVEGLSDGDYRLCAAVPNSTWLNPCEWGLEPLIASVSGAQRTASVSIVLKKGVALQIRVDDPSQLLARDEASTPGALLLLGVPNDARVLRPAPVMSQDASGRNYRVVVPFNRLVKLVAYSSFLQLSDAEGVLLAGNAPHIPVFVPTGVAAAPITVKVTGGK